MQPLKRYYITGLAGLWILGFVLHFVYDWSGQNKLLGLFVPVNESTWEHMKLLFFPMLFFSAIMHQRFSGEFPCIVPALFCGTLAGTFLIPTLFYTYSGILGKNLFPLDIAVFLCSTAAAVFTAYRLTLSCRARPCRTLLFFSMAVLLAAFFLFTYRAPDLGLFANPVLPGAAG
ncbi:MAG: DUF6512 family protein [Eubacteriales bacterium]|nr:DUF6512 family protein [Eubacteriales bacterium]